MGKNDRFINKVKRNLGMLDESFGDNSIKIILMRLKKGKISMERAEALIKKIRFGEKSSKRPSQKSSSSCEPNTPTPNC